jgi:hypothetical protein
MATKELNEFKFVKMRGPSPIATPGSAAEGMASASGDAWSVGEDDRIQISASTGHSLSEDGGPSPRPRTPQEAPATEGRNVAEAAAVDAAKNVPLPLARVAILGICAVALVAVIVNILLFWNAQSL